MAEIVVLLLQHTSQGYDAVASNGPPTDVGCHAAVSVSNVGEHEHNHSPTNQAASRHADSLEMAVAIPCCLLVLRALPLLHRILL